MSRVIVLMYHALYANESEYQAIASIDRPYAVSLEQFRAQLQCITAAGLPVIGPTQTPAAPLNIMLTFDDGHASNYHHAFPILKEKNWPAVFFVTSDFMTTKSDFCNWSQLREMAEQGMTVGAHGQTHGFFDDLSHDELARELSTSYQAISQGIGQAIHTLSFPGGRFRANQLELLRQHHFSLCFSSVVGIAHGLSVNKVIPRIAIRNTTDLTTFQAIIAGAAKFYWRQRIMSAVKSLARRLIGNKLYHSLYDRLAG